MKHFMIFKLLHLKSITKEPNLKQECVSYLFDPKSLINFIRITVAKPKQTAVLLYYMHFDILKTFPVKIPIRDNLN